MAQAQFAHKKWRDWEGLDVDVSVSFPFFALSLVSPDCTMLFPVWLDRAMTVLHKEPAQHTRSVPVGVRKLNGLLRDGPAYLPSLVTARKLHGQDVIVTDE